MENTSQKQEENPLPKKLLANDQSSKVSTYGLSSMFCFVHLLSEILLIFLWAHILLWDHLHSCFSLLEIYKSIIVMSINGSFMRYAVFGG